MHDYLFTGDMMDYLYGAPLDITSNVLTDTYDIWKAKIRVSIKRTLRRSPQLIQYEPETIAEKYLNMNWYQVFYAKTLWIRLDVPETPENIPVIDAPNNPLGYKNSNPWQDIYKRQKEENWWNGQMRLL